MLSRKSGDEGIYRLGLAVDGSGRGRKRTGEMENRELEERVSYSGQEDDVDLDAFSYIDKKIEHVLGHFQKGFQGGVSVETLGAQFGGYGSFLPSYQRSPSILSQPKSPVKIPDHGVSRSPYSSQPKDGHHNPFVLGTTPITKASIASTGNPLEMSDMREDSVGAHTAEGLSHSLSKSVNIGDQKMLKLRINIGRDNGLAKNKPDIYSDLGLDISPSPSLEDTPDESEECSLQSPDAFRESPTTILQIMTCFSVPGGYLSPLPDSLLLSNGKDDIFLGKYETVISDKGRTESCAGSSDTSLNIKFTRSSSRKESKSRERSQMFREVDEFYGMCDEVAILKKESEAKTLVAHSSQGVITTASDVSHTSCSRLGDAREKRQTIGDLEKEIFKDPDNASLKESILLSDVSKDNLVSFAVKPLEERNGNNQESSYAKAEMGTKDLKNYDTAKAVSSRYCGSKNHTTDPKEPVNNNSVQKTSLCDNKQTCGSSRFVEKSKEKLEPNKVDNLQIANSVTDELVVAPTRNNSPTTDAPATISAPVIKDHWVFCDLCQKWRLLPYGTNPKHLPKEWQCSMQVWLPGLNKCYISEDETTKAFHELYQVPAPLNVTSLTIHPDTSISSITSSGLLNPSNLPNGSSSSYLSNSGKNIHPSSGSKSLKCEDSLTKHKIRQISRSIDHTEVKYNHKVEQPSKFLSSCPSEGNLFENCGKQSISKCRRQAEVDGHRSSKKIKKDISDLNTEDPRAAGKVLQSSRNQNHPASKYFRTEPAPVKMTKEHVGTFSSGEHKKNVGASDAENPGKYGSRDKKRELKELQECGTHHKNSMFSQQNANNKHMSKDGSSESELRRQKRAKIAKFEGQDSSAVIVDGEMYKNGCRTRIKLSNSKNAQSHKGDDGSMHALKCVDAMKRNVSNVQSVAAATSSSSKVSESHKSKLKLQEARGSPVESVSSSPMRILSNENNSKNLLTKNHILNTRRLKGSPKISFDGDADGNSDQSGTVTKDSAPKYHIRAAKKSKTAEPGVLDSFYASSDYQGRETKCFSVGESGYGQHAKGVTHNDILTTDYGQTNAVYNDENITNQLNKSPLVESNKNHSCDKNEHHDSGHQMSDKSSSHYRDSKKDCTFGAKKCKIKILDSYSDRKDHLHSNKEDSLDNYSKRHKVSDSRVTVAGTSHSKFILKQNLRQASSQQRQDRSSQIVVDRLEGCSEKVIQASLTVKGKQQKKGRGSQMAPTSNNERSSEQYHVDTVNGGASKSAEQSRRFHDLNEMHSNIFPQRTTSATKCSPMKKDGLTTVNAFIQEARELKHSADHLKNEGSEHKSSGLFFEASLKFLHVASLLESPNSETARQGELFPSLQMYLETAQLCEFCAREYENLKEMAAAALAYKCVEVAYMKVAYFKHPSASKDRHDLQAALDAALPDESPSSSASDVDNLNNQGDSEKAASSRATVSPQIAGNHGIPAQNRPYIKRLLTYTNYLNCAFEATKKSQNAIAVASTDLNKDRPESLCSVRKVLNFNFNNVEGLLKLVRMSLNSISSEG